ncbi:MAG: alpha/beta hydrolase [Xanthomonadales bacterium]|nr:alpha/beta hydrolase [Xanthomonadales bacterium]
MEPQSRPTARQTQPPQPVRLKGYDGLSLAADRYGEINHLPPIIYTHGFGQNRTAWRATASTIAAAGWHGLAIDGRGHGDSGWAADGHYELDQFMYDLCDVVATLPRPPVLVGASMGGLMGLLAQGEGRSDLFHSLILVDVTPRWEASGVERILKFMAAHPDGFASLEAASEAVAAYLPHREGKDPQRLKSQLRLREDGRWLWHWDPRLLGPVSDNAESYIPRLQAAAKRIEVPTLLLSGSRSDVVSESTIDEFLGLVPHAEHVRIEKATHMVVGDRNDEFTAEILRWLQSHASATADCSGSNRSPSNTSSPGVCMSDANLSGESA